MPAASARSHELEVDVVVAGSGAGGMTAALAANAFGLDTIILEKSAQFGGSTAMSGGGAWVPNAPQLQRLGQVDDPAEIAEYLFAIAGDRVSKERLQRYVDAAPKMMAFLEEQSEHLDDAFFWIRGYSDYFPDKGGNPDGRGLWAKPLDRRTLRGHQGELRGGGKKGRIPGVPKGVWLTSKDLHTINQIRWGVGGLKPYQTFLTLASRFLRYWILQERIVSNGAALSSRLWLALNEAGVPLRLSTALTSLVVDADGAVTGVDALTQDGETLRITARRGVVLATGGFAYNPAMRKRYQPEVGAGWGRGSTDDTGDGILVGQEIGAATDLMEDAWWYPVLAPTDGPMSGSGGGIAERQYPGQFIVNSEGKRFVNEAAPYTAFGHAQLSGHKTGVSHIPAWMIFDDRAWKRNIISAHLPGLPMPRSWRNHVKEAVTLEDLAHQIGVPADALIETAARFNEFARRGVDDDFDRGSSPYDNYYGDRSYPNPNLAEVNKAPFKAIRIFPGDLGTKGGLLTDEDARVLREDGTAIRGLYACGNASAAVMGNSYAGPGATIGPAMTFGYVAAVSMAAEGGLPTDGFETSSPSGTVDRTDVAAPNPAPVTSPKPD